VPGGARSDLRSVPQIYHEHNRHGFEVLGWSVNFIPRGFNFWPQGLEIFTPNSRNGSFGVKRLAL
jgi:hypothetical protein